MGSCQAQEKGYIPYRPGGLDLGWKHPAAIPYSPRSVEGFEVL